jgi:Ca2+-transporting ATPase
MRQPPRDPKVPFMNRAMVQSIFSAAAGQFAATVLVYLVTWYSGAGLAVAQTAAFVTWLLGHVLLAFSMRSERMPLVRLGFFSNRVMLWWAMATVLFVLAVTFIPPVQALFKTTPLPSWLWLLAVVSALVGIGWREVMKWILARQ